MDSEVRKARYASGAVTGVGLMIVIGFLALRVAAMMKLRRVSAEMNLTTSSRGRCGSRWYI
jgi:hypothetical protein